MNVEVDDRDATHTELRLGVPGGDRDVVEDAESHRAALESVMARRPHECEAVLLDGDQRAAGGETGGLPGRLVRIRVGQEPGLAVDLLDRGQVLGRVNALDRLSRRRPTFAESRERAEQAREPLGILVVEVALGKVELRQRRMADQIDDAASSNLPASPFIPSSRACAAAAPQSGVTSGSGGSGAERSSVAISR